MSRNSVCNHARTGLNPAIEQTLAIAEQGYIRHFDLFRSVYYLKNKDKRELAAKHYALLNACNRLSETQTYTKTEIFEAYKSFEASTIKHYNSFLRKLKAFSQSGAVSCTHGRIGRKYWYKMNPCVRNWVFDLLSQPNKYGYQQITEYVNQTIKEHNILSNTDYKTISKSLIAYTYIQNKTEIDLYRNGVSQFKIDTRPYLPRITALNAGSLEQMDGTPVQFICWNHHSKWKTEGKKLIRMNLFALRDARSGKVTGIDLSESEDRFNVISAMKMRVKVHGHLPAELVHDNFSATKTDEFKALKEMLENKGVIVRAAKVGNAQDKGEIERFFGTFQSRFQRLIDGYLGEGIKSRRKNGRISEEFIQRHRKENGHYSYDEMQKIIVELVAIYNNTCISDRNGKTPDQIYAECEKPYVKACDMLDTVQLFWLSKTLTVNRSLIVNEVRKQKYFYEIWSNEDKLRLNGKKVRVYYDEKDASEIHVFSLDGEFICTCTQKVGIHEAAVDRQEGEELVIIKHESHNSTLPQYIENKAAERVKAAEQFTGITDMESIQPFTMEKEKINNAESRMYIEAYYEEKGIDMSNVKDYKSMPVNKANNSKSNNNKKDKGIFSIDATYDEA
jgi:hypothetical protein